MLIFFIFLFSTVVASPLKASPVFAVSSQIHDSAALEFIPHSGSGKYSNYLSQTIPFEPVRSLWKALEATEGLRLINRGEAHITVVTPVEYWALRDTLSIDKINALVKAHIQKAPFKVICIGAGSLEVASTTLKTFYLVVKSDALLQIRKTIARAFVSEGGNPGAFEPAAFFPHITIGFTERDLHLEDGIRKDRRSCLYPVRSIP